MQILWLSWRDIKNPDAGGAEKVAIEVTSRLVKDQIPVTIFSSHFPNAKKQENVRGVKIIRHGGLITCRLFAFLYYVRRTDEFDLIIDEINTIPFFSVLYAKNKTITLIHQLAKEYWFKQTIFPLNVLGFIIEPIWLKFYKNSPTLALSTSTKKDLEKLGFTKVKTYRPGINFKPQLVTKKENLILFLGRLIPAKGPDQAIKAFKIIHKSSPDTKLVVAGRGKEKYLKKLKKLTKKLNLQEAIEFKGFVTEKEKINLLKKSKIVLIPSVREGWGLIAIEASALGCVPIAYNVPGLCDSIKNGQNGLLVNTNPQALANATLSILKNESLRFKLAAFGYNWSKQFTWEKCYQDIKSFILKNYDSTKPLRSGINNKRRFLKLLFFLAIFGGLIRLLFATFLPLDGHDETYHLLISQKPLIELLKATISFYPPLWSLILYLLEKISLNYHFLRLASVGIGMTSIIVMGLLGKMFFSPKTGILLALIFTLSPTQIYFNSNLRLYSFSILISLLIFWSFIKYLKINSFKNKILLFSFLTLGNYTYYLLPAISISFATFLWLYKKTFKGKFKEFSLLFLLSILASLPLYIALLNVESGPKEALPNISLLKIISIPISYTFPLNLAQLTNFFPKADLNLTNLLLLVLSLFASILVLLSIKAETNNLKKNLFMILMLLEPVLIVIIFSYLVKPILGIRSLLIFSIPFYLLLGRFLTKSKKISITYIILSLITIFSILIFIVNKPIPRLELFIKHNVNPGEMIIHTEITTYTYFSYLMPQIKHFAAIDSLYTNNTNKQMLGYLPIEIKSLEGKNLWLLEIPSEIHKNLVEQFKFTISKTHNLVLKRKFDEVIISKYENKTK